MAGDWWVAFKKWVQGLQPHVWGIAGVALVIGLAIAVVLRSIVAGWDVVTAIRDALTFLSPLVLVSQVSVQINPILVAGAAGAATLIGALVAAVLAVRAARLARYEQELSTRTAGVVAQQLGVPAEIAITIHAVPTTAVWNRFISLEQTGPDQEVIRRVEAAMETLRAAQAAQVEGFEQRVRAIEEKFPEPAEFQKHADASSLFLAYQVGELKKRIDAIDAKLINRTQVAGIALATLLSAVAVTAGLLAIFKALNLIH